MDFKKAYLGTFDSTSHLMQCQLSNSEYPSPVPSCCLDLKSSETMLFRDQVATQRRNHLAQQLGLSSLQRQAPNVFLGAPQRFLLPEVYCPIYPILLFEPQGAKLMPALNYHFRGLRMRVAPSYMDSRRCSAICRRFKLLMDIFVTSFTSHDLSRQGVRVVMELRLGYPKQKSAVALPRGFKCQYYYRNCGLIIQF